MNNENTPITDNNFMFGKIRNLSTAIIDLQAYILETEGLHDNKTALMGLVQLLFRLQEVEADLKLAFVNRFMEKSSEWDQEKLKHYKDTIYQYKQDSHDAHKKDERIIN